MTEHATGTREEWLAARRELLEQEKELTRRSDEVARQRQALPWVQIDKEYVFATDEGEKRPLLTSKRVSQAVFRPGGRLAVVSSGRVQFLEPDEGPDLIGGHAGEIGCAAFSPDGKQMATGAGYKGCGEIRIWDVSRFEKKP